MPFYDFQYFSGANVLIKIAGHAALEAAAISYNYMDSKQPIYGYSSQTFDAVAPGQKLVQGSLVINYVYDNYLFDCIKKGLRAGGGILSPNVPLPSTQGMTVATPSDSNNVAPTAGSGTLGATPTDIPLTPDQFINNNLNSLSSDLMGKTLDASATSDEAEDSTFLGELPEPTALSNINVTKLQADIDAQASKIWGMNSSNEAIAASTGGNAASVVGAGDSGTWLGDPLSVGGGISIEISYGNRGESLVIDSVHFVGRASSIQIDENVIVEEYAFFARNLRPSLTVL